MYIINITFLVSDAASAKWITWLRNEHIPGITATGLFHTPQLTKVLSQEQDGGVSYAVQYRSNNVDNIELWHHKYEQTIKAQCHTLFGDEVLFFSTILEVLSEK